MCLLSPFSIHHNHITTDNPEDLTPFRSIKISKKRYFLTIAPIFIHDNTIHLGSQCTQKPEAEDTQEAQHTDEVFSSHAQSCLDNALERNGSFKLMIEAPDEILENMDSQNTQEESENTKEKSWDIKEKRLLKLEVNFLKSMGKGDSGL